MPVQLIVGSHQSGKTRRAWERLHACALGTAVLITPSGLLSRDQVRAWHGVFGPGILPTTLSLDALLECVLPSGSSSASSTLATHLVRHELEQGALTGTPLAGIARFRATARDLADTCLRFDAHRLADDELSLAVRSLRGTDDWLSRKLSAIALISRRLAGKQVRARGRHRADAAGQTLLRNRWQTLVFDDLISVTPAEVQVLRELARSCTVVVTAVADARMQSGSLLERLRAAFPDASEEILPQVHALAPHAPLARQVLAGILGGGSLPPRAVDFYHYRDELHAGRAIAAWLRREGIAPGHAAVYLRTMGGESLALADALQAAGVTVRGSFTIALGGTAVGGLLRAVAQWCQQGSWEHFLAVMERLALAEIAVDAARAPLPGGLPGAPHSAADGTVPLPRRESPIPAQQLLGPWSGLPAAAALEQLALLVDNPARDGYEWQEPDRDRPWLRETVSWLRHWLSLLHHASGSWFERFQNVCRLFQLPQFADSVVLLAALEAHAPVGPAELEELLSAQTVSVLRGQDADPDQALLLADAVRGRSEVRPVAILHGLEHGRWPSAPRRSICLSRDERRRFSNAIDGRDPWDELGQASGEMAAFLAVIARATGRVACGIPCGERIPSSYLGTLAAQLGVDLVSERGQAAAEAVPGAPLGDHDSQGEHEHALWTPVARRPDFHFRIPARPAGDLGVSASRLNDLLCDPFAFVLGTLALDPPLSSVQRRRDGQDLHGLLSELALHPPAQWAQQLEGLLGRWVAMAGDHLAGSARLRACRMVRAAMAAEISLVQDCQVLSEQTLEIPIPQSDAAGGVLLRLRGKADRLDRDPQGLYRIVDYKFSAVTSYRALVKHQQEGQLAAYAAGIAARGEVVGGAHYRALLDGDAAGYQGPLSPDKLGTSPPDVAQLPARLVQIALAIEALSAGAAHTDPEQGLCEARGYAPIARLDEARLQTPDGSEGEE